MENDMTENRTMIAGVFSPDRAKDHVVFSDGTTEPTAEAKVLIGDEGKAPEVITYGGEAYARLPEGWPAADAKDLEEAHAEAVASDEPGDWEDQIRDIYASFTPEEVQELCEDWVRLVKEVAALRKGMKTMQRKTRKQNQVQRRLERRLAQARAGRDRAQENVSFYVKSSLARAIAEIEPQVNTGLGDQ